MGDILEEIKTYKLIEVAERKARISEANLWVAALNAKPARGFTDALRVCDGPALIAEIKKASPSKGLIREDFNPPALASAYERGGAACLSVLTDAPSFQGHNDFLAAARNAVTIPALRKDFIVDTYQIYESRAMGADCILIIMAMIDDKLASHILSAATDLGMDALIETHDYEEMQRAIDLGGTLIGINNRNLKTFETSLKVFETLAPLAPKDALLVAESGIYTSKDIAHLTSCGAHAFLVGESLMRQTDVQKATERLINKTC